MRIARFSDLEIWKESRRLTIVVYDITQASGISKDFALRDQIRRAMVSVSSNIVEGFERRNNNEFIRYLKIAKPSLSEVRNQLGIASDIGYLPQANGQQIDDQLCILGKRIGCLIGYLVEQRNAGSFKQTR